MGHGVRPTRGWLPRPHGGTSSCGMCSRIDKEPPGTMKRPWTVGRVAAGGRASRAKALYIGLRVRTFGTCVSAPPASAPCSFEKSVIILRQLPTTFLFSLEKLILAPSGFYLLKSANSIGPPFRQTRQLQHHGSPLHSVPVVICLGMKGTQKQGYGKP
jgi:hypothetical protein